MTPSARRPYREFGAWLRSRRLARRWTQDELARRLDYDVTYVRKIEWGERRASDALRVRLAEVLGVPPSSIPPPVPVRPPTTLPEPPGPLVGRADDLAAVTALFDGGSRLVTLLGAPGIGKTRLALALAGRFDDNLHGGAAFVPLADVPSASGVAGAIGQALGVTIPGGPAELQPVVAGLRGQDTLLVLDNFAHVLDAAPLVEELLGRVPTLRVLVTSRQALDLRRETQYPVPALRVPEPSDEALDRLADVEAVALFVARAARVNPDFRLDEDNASAVAQVCHRLQGIPLAIELAAGTARFLTPTQLLAQLRDGLDLPVAGPRDAPAHQRTLRAAVGWSFELLTDDERVVMRRLAVFAGGCTLEAAAEVCTLPGEDRPDHARTLLSLAGKSLLEPMPGPSGGARFVALDSVRAFALELLGAAGEVDPTQRRHAAWFVQLADAYEPCLTGPRQADALAVLEAEHANLTAALRWSLAHDPATATRLCARLWRFWWMRGRLSEGRAWLDAALALPQRDATTHALALVGAGVLARTQGDYDRAVDLVEQAAAVARSVDARPELALALINVGNVALDRGSLGRAAARFEEARALYAEVGDERGVGHSINCLGTVRLGEGDLDAAAALFEEAAAAFREVQDNWSLAMAVANLGWTAQQQGRTEVAQRTYEKALAMYRALGDDRTVATMLLNLGIARCGSASGDDVAGLFNEALLTFVRLGERRGIAECLERLGDLRAAEDPRNAAVLLGAAEETRRRIGVGASPGDDPTRSPAVERLRAALG
ncbi:MAG: tetratricopeptide repeat protein, partial [Actinomycetota bacterium]|nr:tetratricopeptide repeat protein [Actinomycetota bacterium]